MLQILSKKWWVILVQGMLLIILSIYIFNNPLQVLAGFSVWFGLIIISAGLLGVIAWLGSDEFEKEDMSILWSLLTIVFGMLILINLTAVMESITIVFGLWMLVTGSHLAKTGWAIKDRNSLGWIIVVSGILSLITAFMMIFNIGSGAVGISILLGLQVLIAGLALELLSFAKKTFNVKEKIQINASVKST